MHYPTARAALALGLVQAFTVNAQSAADTPIVVVTATRFASADPHVPANISVISRQEIAESPAATLPGLLGSRAGINVRSLYGALATDATVDLRSFGDSAASNTLILLDGQRINAIDSSGINWSTVPLDAVQRIEILRGSGSVLYGDRASGGVINIITRRSDQPETSASLGAGSYGYLAADAHTAGGNGTSYFNLNAHHAQADGWRHNSQTDQDSIAGRGGARFAAGEGFIDFAGYRDSSGTPGALFRSQYLNQPDMARFPLNTQSNEGYRLRPGVTVALSAELTLEAELADTENRYHGRMFSPTDAPSFSGDRKSDNLSATPRLRWNHGLGGLGSETVVGLDYYDARVDNANWYSYSGTNLQRAKQTSEAAYLQNVTALNANIDLTLGIRQQRMRQQAEDVAAAMNNTVTRNRNAWEAGLTGRVTNDLRVFGRSGHSFRFANTDELFGFDPMTYATIFRGDLKPQQGTLHELGGAWCRGDFSAQASIFRLDLSDEIAYDGNSFTNINLAPTRRQGLEFELQWQPARDWITRLALSSTNATFRGGVDDGKTIPMAPHNKATLGVTWKGGRAGTWSALANHVGDQRYSGDTANTRDLMPAYTTADLQAAWNFASWTFTARIANLFDKRYSSFAGYSASYADYFYYPADPRSIFLTVGYRFR